MLLFEGVCSFYIIKVQSQLLPVLILNISFLPLHFTSFVYILYITCQTFQDTSTMFALKSNLAYIERLISIIATIISYFWWSVNVKSGL